MAFVIGVGIQNEATRLGETITGELLSDEIYVKDALGKDAYSFAVYERVEIRHYPGPDKTTSIPFLAGAGR